jgi:hypothetical protein
MRSRRSSFCLAGAMSLALVVTGGCDSDDPSPPPPVPAAPTTQPEPVSRRPTTQQLISGAWKTVPVSLLPLNIDMPESWEVVPAANGGLLAVEGFSPAGFVQIRMSSRNSIPVDTFDGFVKSARSAAEANGDRLRKFEVKPGDPLTLIERQIAGDREPMPVTDEQGNLILREATPLRWSILLFLKTGQKYETFEMQFDAMSLEHYQQDEAFLRKIVDSLAFDPSRQRG